MKLANLFHSHKFTDARLPTKLQPVHRDNLIRLGAKRDGGYVLTQEILDASDFLLSCGLGYEWSFENAFAEAKKSSGCIFHGYDPTIINEEKLNQLIHRCKWRSKISSHHRNKLNLLLNHKEFFGGIPGKHYSEWIKAKAITDNDVDINQAITRTNSNAILLSIDIESDEYEVLPEVMKSAEKITGILCEFHHIDKRLDDLLCLVETLKEEFDLIHITSNNNDALTDKHVPITLELSFENKKLSSIDNKPSQRNYPIEGIDFRNKPTVVDYKLSFSD